MQKFYVTTAIDYVNAAPHIGHAYEKIAADVLARHYRMRGRDVYFLTGSDEHGSKIEKSAHAQNKSPKAFCDEMSQKFKEAWGSLNLSFDKFIRTTEPNHEAVVQKIFQKLLEKGDIYKGSYMGLYCEGCEDYVRERDLNDDGHCPTHLKAPIVSKEENYFFALSKYKFRLQDWLAANPDVVRPEAKRKEILKLLEDPELGDFSVSRSRSSLTWGIPVPNDTDQVIYVWIDALSNYITGAGYLSDDVMFSRYWPASVHLIGKDILKFHAIYWPAMLMSLDITLPEQIYAHGFITVEGQKISKSIGNVIDPVALCTAYGADAVRFYLLASTPFDQDGDFSREEFINKVNSELANNLGNLLNRTLTLIERNCEGLVPQAKMENTLREEANEVSVAVDKFLSNLEFAKAIEAILALVDQANKYMNDERPWTLYKEGNKAQGDEVLYTTLEILRRVALLQYPFTPKLCSDIWRQIGFTFPIEEVGRQEGAFWEVIKAGQPVKNEGPIFKRIEEEASVQARV
jgi:methionyl-tRNA synthetase